jgi:hypothetical protein
MRHANWNPTKHRRLPNGQWAPSGRGKLVMSKKPRSYASRATHKSQVGRAKVYANHNAKLRSQKSKYTKARIIAGAALMAGGAAAMAYGGSNLYLAHTLKGGPKR